MMKRPEVWAKTTFTLDISTLAFTKPFNTWPISDPYNIEELKPSDCGDKITRGFEVNTSTIYFTLGRCPEMCSSPPAMRWVDKSGNPKEVVLLPASNWNVISFWQAGNYAVFGLEAEYELGSKDEALGIWNLKTGQFNLLSVEKTNLGTELGDWKNSRLAATKTAVILKSPLAAAVFLTKAKKISISSNTTHVQNPAGSDK